MPQVHAPGSCPRLMPGTHARESNLSAGPRVYRAHENRDTRIMASSASGATYGSAVPEGAPALPPRISWGAVLAGGVVAVAVGTMLNILGVAIGASTVDATASATPGASSFGIGAGIWLLVANLIGLAVGGYVAARLSGTADATDSVLHGLSV